MKIPEGASIRSKYSVNYALSLNIYLGWLLDR